MSQRFKFRGLEYWAERGLVRIEDQNTGEFFTISRQEAFDRAKAIAAEIPNIIWGDEREAIISLVQKLCDVIKEAEAQGDPSDEEVRKYMGKQVKNTRRAKLLLPETPVFNTDADSEVVHNKPKIVLGT